jgi:hypothetical protein
MPQQSARAITGSTIAILLAVVFISGSFVVPVKVHAAPGACPSDSKLLNDGPTLVFGEGPGTWWGLIQGGFAAAGAALDTEQEQIDYLNGLFGTNYSDLKSLKDFNLQQVSAVWDQNGNGYVCAFDLRGTRAFLHDPLSQFTFFGVTDDKVAKK